MNPNNHSCVWAVDVVVKPLILIFNYILTFLMNVIGQYCCVLFVLLNLLCVSTLLTIVGPTQKVEIGYHESHFP